MNQIFQHLMKPQLDIDHAMIGQTFSMNFVVISPNTSSIISGIISSLTDKNWRIREIFSKLDAIDDLSESNM